MKNSKIFKFLYLSLKIHPCPQCNNRYSMFSELIIHYRISHLKYLAYQCKVCESRVSTLSNAKYHYIWVHCKDERHGKGQDQVLS